MNKQEAIRELMSKSREIIFGDDENVYLSRKRTIELVSQIDEPQKVVVPKFVAEWIECCKHDKFYALHGAYADMDDRLKCWRFRGDNSELFAKAWIYGYEIEQEKLYTVEIADAILTKITRGRNIQYKMLPFKDVSGFFDKAIYNTKLTEQEIKETDERLWQFAKEAE